MSQKDDAGVETKDGQGAEDHDGVKKNPDGSVQEPDWEAIAKKERERAENYKKALTQKRQLRNKPESEDNVDEEDDDRPLTRKDIRNVLQEEVVPLVLQNKEEDLLKAKVADPSKRDAVKAILESSIKRTGTSDEAILADIEKALAIADSHKLKKTNEELKRVIQNKPSNSSDEGGSSEKDIEINKIDPKFKVQLEERARALGVDPKKFIEQYSKNKGRTSILG